MSMFIYLVCAFSLGGVFLQTAADDEPDEPQSSSKYYFEAVFLGNYFQATQYCNYHGLNLLSIESAEEDVYLYKTLQNFIGNGGYTFWTSGTRLPQDHWVWLSTGKPISYSPWTTPPINANKCLDVGYSNNNNALVWNAANCSIGRHTICKTPSSSVAALAFTFYNSNLSLLN